MVALRVLARAVGGKLFFLPATVSGIIAWLDYFGVVVADVPVIWFIVAAPVLFWLLVGLLIQAVSLQKNLDLDPVADWSMQKAFQHLMLYSEHSIGTDSDDDAFYTEIEVTLRDAARLGRLCVWARQVQTMRGGFRQTIMNLPQSDWEHLRISLPTCVHDQAESALILDYHTDPWTQYEHAQVNRSQVLNLWPKASWWRRWRDRRYKQRLAFYEKERQGMQ